MGARIKIIGAAGLVGLYLATCSGRADAQSDARSPAAVADSPAPVAAVMTSSEPTSAKPAGPTE